MTRTREERETARTIDGHLCRQCSPALRTKERAIRWMDGKERDHPGYWVKLTARIYAYREHTGDITYWRSEKP
jgi:hypothetical protein